MKNVDDILHITKRIEMIDLKNMIEILLNENKAIYFLIIRS